MEIHQLLKRLFDASVTAVRGDISVAAALSDWLGKDPDQIIAVGKAATAMAQAAHARFPNTPIIIVTKYGHAEGAPAQAEVIEAAHPVLDKMSLKAGARLREIIGQMGENSHVLMLVSGGASALVEDPIEGIDLGGLAFRAREMLGSGADIHEMNAARKTLSRVKGGKLLTDFPGARVTTLAISDVEGDSLSVIGSGIGNAAPDSSFLFESQIVASNLIARNAAAQVAMASGFEIHANAETLYDDIHPIARAIARGLLDGKPGAYIFGGEPTVVLPPTPGHGGRNQALALLIAREIAGTQGLHVLVAGTDGSDGPTDAAGAIVYGSTWEPSGHDALTRADAGTWLDARGALLCTGPTGTNVMDVVIAIVSRPSI